MKISKNSKGIGWEKENSDINIDGENIDLTSYAKKSQLPTKTSQLQNDSDFATNASVDEKIANAGTGETVDLASYAKKTDLPTKTSQLTNDSNFISSIPEEYVTEQELNSTIQDYTGGKKQIYLTQAEYDILSDVDKNDSTKVYNITDATEQVIPTDLTINDNNLLQLKDANGNAIGTGVTVSTTSGGSNSYTLPIASNTVLGGIKVGDRLSIDNNGVLSADIQSGGSTGVFSQLGIISKQNVITINKQDKTIKFFNYIVIQNHGTPKTYVYNNGNAEGLSFEGLGNYIYLYFNTSNSTFGVCGISTDVPSTSKLYITSFSLDGNTSGFNDNAILYCENRSREVNISILGDSLSSDLGWANIVKTKLAYEKIAVTFNNMAVFNTCLSTNGVIADYMCNRIDNMPSTTDILIIFGGSNDAASNVAIGEFNTLDKATYIGAYETILRKAYEINPKVRILLISPTPRFDGNFKTNQSKLIEISNTIDTIASNYNLSYLNLYKKSGINSYNQTVYLRDNIHYTPYGKSCVASIIQEYLRELISYYNKESVVNTLITSVNSMSINEGNTGSFTVKLELSPSSDVTVNLACDEGITLNKNTLTFTPSNYSTAQTVTITTTHDDDYIDNNYTVTLQADGFTSKGINVTVTDIDTPPTVAVTGVKLDIHSKSISIGETFNLTATISPTDAANKNVMWSTTNDAVATVINGKVKGITEGDTTIQVTTEDGKFTDTCTVNVSGATSANTYLFANISANNVSGTTLTESVSGKTITVPTALTLTENNYLQMNGVKKIDFTLQDINNLTVSDLKTKGFTLFYKIKDLESDSAPQNDLEFGGSGWQSLCAIKSLTAPEISVYYKKHSKTKLTVDNTSDIIMTCSVDLENLQSSIYINGELLETKNIESVTYDFNSKVSIGNPVPSADYPCPIYKFKQLLIYGKALTSDDIVSIVNTMD